MPIINHVGIAVNTLAQAIPLFEAILGQEISGTEEVEGERVRVAFFGEGPGRVELLEATDPTSPIARFIAKRGTGLHHLCLSVPDLDQAVARACGEGAELIEPGIRVGAGGHRVAFLHPATAGGVLLELSEDAAA